MTTVTVEEAVENLPELLRRIATGEELIITEGGKWMAMVGPPPRKPPTEAEIDGHRARAEEAVRDIMALREEWHQEHPEGISVQELLDEERGED